VGGNSFAVSGANLTVSENDRVFLIGTTQPTVSGGSATYTTPNTIIRERDDDAAGIISNSMVTSNSDGLVQFFSEPALYDCIIQDSNQGNQGFIADLPVGAVEGVSTTFASVFGATATFNGETVFGATATFNSDVILGSTTTITVGTGLETIVGRVAWASPLGKRNLSTYPHGMAVAFENVSTQTVQRLHEWVKARPGR